MMPWSRFAECSVLSVQCSDWRAIECTNPKDLRRGIIGRWSAATPGRNVRRSAGHGSGAHQVAARPNHSRLKNVNANQRERIPAALAVASSGVGNGKAVSNSKAAKRKNVSLGKSKPRPPSSEAMDGRLKHG